MVGKTGGHGKKVCCVSCQEALKLLLNVCDSVDDLKSSEKKRLVK